MIGRIILSKIPIVGARKIVQGQRQILYLWSIPVGSPIWVGAPTPHSALSIRRCNPGDLQHHRVGKAPHPQDKHWITTVGQGDQEPPGKDPKSFENCLGRLLKIQCNGYQNSNGTFSEKKGGAPACKSWAKFFKLFLQPHISSYLKFPHNLYFTLSVYYNNYLYIYSNYYT